MDLPFSHRIPFGWRDEGYATLILTGDSLGFSMYKLTNAENKVMIKIIK